MHMWIRSAALAGHRPTTSIHTLDRGESYRKAEWISKKRGGSLDKRRSAVRCLGKRRRDYGRLFIGPTTRGGKGEGGESPEWGWTVGGGIW